MDSTAAKGYNNKLPQEAVTIEQITTLLKAEFKAEFNDLKRGLLVKFKNNPEEQKSLMLAALTEHSKQNESEDDDESLLDPNQDPVGFIKEVVATTKGALALAQKAMDELNNAQIARETELAERQEAHQGTMEDQKKLLHKQQSSLDKLAAEISQRNKETTKKEQRLKEMQDHLQLVRDEVEASQKDVEKTAAAIKAFAMQTSTSVSMMSRISDFAIPSGKPEEDKVKTQDASVEAPEILAKKASSITFPTTSEGINKPSIKSGLFLPSTSREKETLPEEELLDISSQGDVLVGSDLSELGDLVGDFFSELGEDEENDILHINES